MPVVSGRHGLLSLNETIVTHMRNWNLTDVQAPVTYSSSQTKLAMGRKTGIRSWQGSFQGYGGYPGFVPGEYLDFLGYKGNDAGDETPSEVAGGEILITSLDITWNWQSNEVISWQAAFTGNGEIAYTTPDLELPSDGTAPPTPCNTQWNRNTVAIPALTTGTLNLSCTAIETVNSNSYANGFCWKGVKPGIKDAKASVTQESDTQPYTVGELITLRCNIDATTYWELAYMHFLGYSNIQVNRETGAIITQNLDYEMSIISGSTTGSIQHSGGKIFV